MEQARAATGRISGFYMRQGLYPEVERLNQELLDREVHPATLTWLGRALLDRAQHGPARGYYQRALEVAGEVDAKAEALHGLATIDLREGAYPAAREKFERALAMRQQIGDRAGEATAWHQLASIDLNEGAYPAAREKFERSLAIKQQIGDRVGEAATWHQLATIDVNEGAYPAAREKLERSLTTRQQIGDRAGEAAAWHNLATIDLREGAYPAAREKFERALAMRQQIGDRAGEAATWHQLGSLAVQRGKAAEGLRLVGLCYRIDREIGHGDTESDWRAVTQLAAQLDYTQDQLNAALREAGESYARDRGSELLQQAFA
jgi:tetratricopeptide (TPR) repeat protein